MTADELRQLDREMAAIMDWAWDEETQGWLYNKPDGKVGSWPDAEWRPTEDIRQAWMVAKALRAKGWHLHLSAYLKTATCQFHYAGTNVLTAICESHADHPALAICLAAKATTEGER